MNIKERRSNVRVRVTYAAAFFLFVMGPILIVLLLWYDKPRLAIDLFLSILPISSAVVSYWFATRSTEAKPDTEENQPHETGEGKSP